MSRMSRQVGLTADAGSDNLEAMALKTLSPAQARSWGVSEALGVASRWRFLNRVCEIHGVCCPVGQTWSFIQGKAQMLRRMGSRLACFH